MEENFSFGYWLRRQRLARDLRQADLAVQLGIAPITLRKIEADERRPSLQLIIRVAELFALNEAERTILRQVARADLSPAALPMPERARDDQPAEISASTPTVLPTGTVTLLLAEIEHAAALWERYPDLIRGALARSIACFQTAVAAHGGVVVQSAGDQMRAAFPLAIDALHAALAAQRALLANDWGALGALRVGMALHSGMVGSSDGDLIGPTPNRAARLLGAAEAFGERHTLVIEPEAERDHTRTVNAIRATLSDSAFAEAVAAGRALTLDEALAEGQRR